MAMEVLVDGEHVEAMEDGIHMEVMVGVMEALEEEQETQAEVMRVDRVEDQR